MLGVFLCGRFLPVLRVLGSDVDADVLHHRPVGRRAREYAAIKFFLFTLVGSVLMLVAILMLYFYSNPPPFDILTLTEIGQTSRLAVPSDDSLG